MGKRTERMLNASLKHILKVNEDLKKKLKGKNHGELINITNEPCDIIRLNVGGSEMFATRDTLTAIQGSRIEALFAGEWDDHLLLDDKGRIFMDLDPSLFETILEYLSTAKISGVEDPVLPKLPNVGHDKHEVFCLYLEFFGLLGKQEAGFHGDNNISSCSGVDNCSDNEDPMMQSFISFFTDQEHESQDEDYASMEDSIEADAYFFPDEQDQSRDEEATRSNDFQILHLQFINGSAMSVKRSTLCSIASSKLSEEFGDDKWLENHLIVNENGQKCILVEHCTTAFKALVEQLRLRSMSGDHSRIPSVRVPYHDDFEGQSLKKLSAYYFPNNKSVICFSDDDDLSEQNATQVPVASNVSDLKVYVYTDSKVSELSSSCNAKINALEVKMENTKSEYEKNLIHHERTSEATAIRLKTLLLETNTDSKFSELSSSCDAKINALEVKMENTKSEYKKNLIQHKSTSEATATELKTLLLETNTDSKFSELSSSCDAKINALEVKMEKTKSEYEKNLIQHERTSEATATELRNSLEKKMKYLTLASEQEQNMSEIMAKCVTRMDSVILESTSDCDKIKEWLASVNKTIEPKLLYRASRDGWDACDFHRCCDSKGATITVVKCTEGNVFGGYTSKSWASPVRYTVVTDDDTFLFSLKSKEDLGAIKLCAYQNKRVYTHKSRGPMFGFRTDLVLGSRPNVLSGLSDSNKCYTSVGSTYKLPNGITDPHFLAGSEYFRVKEYEVFQV